MAETQTPQTQDAPGEFVLYHKSMTRVYIANGRPEERSALRLLLLDLKMEVVGEAADWTSTLANAPATRLDLLLIDWNLLPRSIPNTALNALRKVCPATLVIVLISHLEARQQAASARENLSRVTQERASNTTELAETERRLQQGREAWA